MVKGYFGRRLPEGGAKVWVDSGRHGYQPELPLALELWNHSPTGFEWGYGGSGPAQLALAILYDLTGERGTALAYHQAFKRDWIAVLPHDGWYLSAATVLAWLDQARAAAVAALDADEQGGEK